MLPNIPRVRWLVVCACALAAAPALAQTPVGTAFTYQGRLTENGSPAHGVYDLRFILYTAEAGGSQVGSIVTKDDVTVTSGLFAVSLDFGAAAFTGEARWLEVGARPGASTGAFVILSPRQELTPSPNAVFSQKTPWTGITGIPSGFADGTDNDVLGGLSCAGGQVAKWNGTAWACAADADSGGDITAVTAGSGLTGGGVSGDLTLSASFGGSGIATSLARSDHEHFGQIWAGTAGNGLRVDNQQASGSGVFGYAAATGGSTSGVFGQSDSSEGRGVWGYAGATSGTTNGVFGASNSTDGRGVFGYAYGSSGPNYGVYGQSYSTQGQGVHGYAGATSGPAYGVFGASNSTEGLGVLGYAGATSGGTYGVGGYSNSSQGQGVLGYASATSGPTYGVFGASTSSQGQGVWGHATATAGSTFGVFGSNAAPGGAGVLGLATAASGTPAGVEGSSISATGFGGRFSNLAGGTALWVDGRAGILTATPATPLDVAGVIRSSTGGFRFPDDTTQTTAAIDTNSGGTVQSVATGAGLTGGPITLTGTVSVATGGISSSMIANGAVGSPQIASGAVGLAQINQAQVQARISGTCPIGQYFRGIASDGSVVCEPVPGVPAITTVDDPANDVGLYTSIAIGSDGLPVISYLDGTAGTLKVAKCANAACTGTSTITTVDDPTNDVGWYTSIAIGTDGLPVISYYDGTANALKVAKCANAACTGASTITTVDDPTNDVGWYTSIAIGADGLPVISYFDYTAYALKVAHCGNAACTPDLGDTITTVDDPANNVGVFTSIAIGTDGLPVISYSDSTAGALKVAHCGNAACTPDLGDTITTVDDPANSVGYFTSIAIGTDGFPVISYYDSTAAALKVAKCVNAACTGASTITTADDPANYVGSETSIAIGTDGLPVISYQDMTAGALKVAKCANAACTGASTITTVDDPANSVGWYTSIAIGTDGLPVISHRDITAAALKVAKCGTRSCQ